LFDKFNIEIPLMQAIKDSPRYLKIFQDSKKNKEKLKPMHNMHYKSVLALQACSLPENNVILEFLMFLV